MKNTPLFCCLLIILSACSKDNALHTWEGTVLEYGTMKAVPGAAVYLIEAKGSILGPTIKSVVDSTLSDHNGHFKFTFEFNPYISEISGKAHNYFDGSDVIGTTKNTNKDLILDPYAWLNVDIDCQHPDLYQIVINNFECTPRSFINGERSVSSICTFRGNRTNKFSLLIGILNNQSVRDTIELFLPALDTTHLELNY